MPELPNLPVDAGPLVLPPMERIYADGAQPLLSAALAELHTQIAQLPADAKASLMAAVDVHGNAKIVVVGKVGDGWTYVVTGQRYDGQFSGLAGVQKTW